MNIERDNTIPDKRAKEEERGKERGGGERGGEEGEMNSHQVSCKLEE